MWDFVERVWSLDWNRQDRCAVTNFYCYTSWREIGKFFRGLIYLFIYLMCGFYYNYFICFIATCLLISCITRIWINGIFISLSKYWCHHANITSITTSLLHLLLLIIGGADGPPIFRYFMFNSTGWVKKRNPRPMTVILSNLNRLKKLLEDSLVNLQLNGY